MTTARKGVTTRTHFTRCEPALALFSCNRPEGRDARLLTNAMARICPPNTPRAKKGLNKRLALYRFSSSSVGAGTGGQRGDGVCRKGYQHTRKTHTVQGVQEARCATAPARAQTLQLHERFDQALDLIVVVAVQLRLGGPLV
jgi:hypothetical protein